VLRRKELTMSNLALLEPTTARTSIPVDDDAAIVARIAQRDESALADAYRLHSRAVYGAAYSVLRRAGTAEDVTQEVFVRLWNRYGRFDPERGSLKSYLRIDARGRAIDLLRSERARRDREDRDSRLAHRPVESGVEDAVVTRVVSEGVREVLVSLRPEERDPIALAFFDGHSYRRVAEILGLPEGTVKSRIRSGLANLKALMAASPQVAA
jgi:RNA polymerase sigma-70 factor (ECF subfamily)